MLKFLVKDSPHSELFGHYVSTLSQLAHNEPAQIVLRKFELLLLTESGLIGELSICTSSKKRLLPSLYYVLEPERGARPARAEDKIPKVLGKTLLDMCNEDYSDPTTQLQSKMLMRFLLAHHLHGIPLNTRQILIDLQKL